METIITKLQTVLSRLSEQELSELQETLDQVFTEEKLAKNPKIGLKTGWAKGHEDDPGDYLSIYLRLTEKED